MNRNQLNQYIYEVYHCKPDCPWFSHPTYAVYRHDHNRKWFAVMMDIPKSKLGLKSNETVSIINVKCDYSLICELLQKDGYFPAYHMSKKNWISIALDGSADDKDIKFLLDLSYEVTKPPPYK